MARPPLQAVVFPPGSGRRRWCGGSTRLAGSREQRERHVARAEQLPDGRFEGRGNSRLKILAITVLTSVGQNGLRDLGYSCSVEELVGLRVQRALAWGCDGIVAAPHDNPDELRRRAGAERLLIVTPGVRLAGSSADDHKRPGTPAQAIAAGADYLVVGRPIVKNEDPARAAIQIIEDMRHAV